MDQEGRRKRIAKKLKNKYRLVIMNDESFEENFSFKLSPLNVISWGSLLGLSLIAFVISLIAFTPLREYIPGYSNTQTKKNAAYAVYKVDSLDAELHMRDRWINNVRAVLSGEIAPDSIENIKDTSISYDEISYERSKADSVFRGEVEAQDQFSLSQSQERSSSNTSFYFTPLKGEITSSFNREKKHFAVDVSAKEGEAIKAVLEGKVVFAEWTAGNGNVIQIQHHNNVISIYKHCSALLKAQGDDVKAGEVIAIVGNTGDHSTGPHLHFELWENGKAIDPLKFISF